MAVSSPGRSPLTNFQARLRAIADRLPSSTRCYTFCPRGHGVSGELAGTIENAEIIAVLCERTRSNHARLAKGDSEQFCENNLFTGTASRNLVRMRGLEPPLPCENQNLNLARLPIPPHPHLPRRWAPWLQSRLQSTRNPYIMRLVSEVPESSASAFSATSAIRVDFSIKPHPRPCCGPCLSRTEQRPRV